MLKFLAGFLSVTIGASSVSGDISGEGAGTRIVGSGKPFAQRRDAQAPFDSVEVHGSINLKVTRDSKITLTVLGDDNLVDLVETTWDGTTLRVGLLPGYQIQTRNPLEVVATAPRVKRAVLTGSGDIVLKDLSQSELRIDLRGSGDVTAGGSVDQVELTVQGSGSIKAGHLKADIVLAALKGSGDIVAQANETAKVRVSGSGDVRIMGNPVVRDARVTGSGDISFEEP